MSASHLDDEYDEYNYDQDKLVNSGHSGKNRSKKEASEHTNHNDPSGHSRKLQTKLHNTEINKKEEQLKPHPVTRNKHQFEKLVAHRTNDEQKKSLKEHSLRCCQFHHNIANEVCQYLFKV